MALSFLPFWVIDAGAFASAAFALSPCRSHVPLLAPRGSPHFPALAVPPQACRAGGAQSHLFGRKTLAAGERRASRSNRRGGRAWPRVSRCSPACSRGLPAGRSRFPPAHGCREAARENSVPPGGVQTLLLLPSRERKKASFQTC